MKIVGHVCGKNYAPLDRITVRGRGRLVVSDGARRVYHDREVEGEHTFVVGGALGTQLASMGSDSVAFQVDARTAIEDGSGRFRELLTMLQYTILSEGGEEHTCLWNGKIYRYFICWLRDHVHVLKGMKYFEPDVKSAIELYRDSQREDGMIWDNCCQRGQDENYWLVRFSEGGFYRAFEDKTFEFKRIPVENDVEYLFVEGIYNTWKATGDDAWMESCLDAAKRALAYTIRDTDYRFSSVLGLPKRGYTIDTWDFQADIDCNVEGDIMRVRPGTTRFGAMFGDTTGYVAACRQLAEMLTVVGHANEAKVYLGTANSLLERLDEVSWRGTHYQMHVSEDPSVGRDLGVDETKQVSLSNAYSLNRGIGREKCWAIIESYLAIKADLPDGSPGEWYTIYPPFERGFGGHSDKWQYMNASVTPIVAGELAHGAFENGYEAYGADILSRLVDLGRRFDNRFHCSYTGSLPSPSERRYRTLDIASHARSDVRGPGFETSPNDLRELPEGLCEFAGVPFQAPHNAIGVSDLSGFSREVSVSVPSGMKHSRSVFLFHTVSGGVTIAGTVVLRYADGTEYRHAVLRGRDVVHWWMPELPEKTGRRTLEIGWKGKNDVLPYVGVSVCGLDNPHPDKELSSVVFQSAPEDAVWYVLGLTACDQEASFPTSPISFGIPDGWGASAVVYALVEGLAGVVDTSRAFEAACVSPRWVAAGEDRAKVTITYPASGGYVAYEYRHDPNGKTITLELTGSGERAEVRVMLPKGSRPVGLEGEQVDGTTYAVIHGQPLSPNTLVIRYE